MRCVLYLTLLCFLAPCCLYASSIVCLLFFIVLYLFLLYFFFFSSRRRHTRCSRDWSSDVCSSDLPPSLLGLLEPRDHLGRDVEGRVGGDDDAGRVGVEDQLVVALGADALDHAEIGRASCRERV